MSGTVMEPIGYVRGGRTTIEDDGWAQVVSSVELDPDQIDAAGLEGLGAFSHVEVVYVFDQVDPETICRGKRHPRGRADWPEVGILAQRAKDHPNDLVRVIIQSDTGATGAATARLHPHHLTSNALDRRSTARGLARDPPRGPSHNA